jgi:hypothetical protein
VHFYTIFKHNYKNKFLHKMKKYIYALLTTCILIVSNVYAQVPDSINYQAVLRKTDGTLVTNGTIVKFEFEIKVGVNTYLETQDVTINNNFGLANTKIGAGTTTSTPNKLSKINWKAGNAMLNVRVAIPSTATLDQLSNTSLVTVPYAFYSDKAGKAVFADSTKHIATGISGNTLTIGDKNITLPQTQSSIVQAGTTGTVTVVPSGTNPITYTIDAKGIKDTIVTTAITSSNIIEITKNPVTGSGKITYEITSKLPDLSFIGDSFYVATQNGSVTVLNKGIGVYDKILKNKIVDTLTSTISFNNTNKPQSITRVDNDPLKNRVYVYTPLPVLNFNKTTKILTIKDSLDGTIKNTVDLSGIAGTTYTGTANNIIISSGNVISAIDSTYSFKVNNAGTSTTKRLDIAKAVNVLNTGYTFTTSPQILSNVSGLSSTPDTVKLSMGGGYALIPKNTATAPVFTPATGNYSIITGTYPNYTTATTNTLSSSGNNITSDVNGVMDTAPIIDTVINTIIANKLITTVNGVASFPIALPATGIASINIKNTAIFNDTILNLTNNNYSLSLKQQTQAKFLASPTSSTGVPSFRVFADTDFDNTGVIQNNLGAINYIPKFSVGVGATRKITNSKLYESAIVGNIGFIGWGTITPRNNFVIHETGGTNASFQLTNNSLLASNDGFVAKFISPILGTTFSTAGNMLFTDNSATPFERLKLTNTDVYIGKSGSNTNLNLYGELKPAGISGATGEVLTWDGANNPPKWALPAGGSIWTLNNNNVSLTVPNNTVIIGASTAAKAHLEINTTTMDTAIIANTSNNTSSTNTQVGIFAKSRHSTNAIKNYAGVFDGTVKINHADPYNRGLEILYTSDESKLAGNAAIHSTINGKGYAGYFTNGDENYPSLFGQSTMGSNTAGVAAIGVRGLVAYSVSNNNNLGYGVKGVTEGAIGNSALQSNTTTSALYSAGVFGETKLPSTGASPNDITYGVMGITSSHHVQAAGVFGLAGESNIVTDSSDGIRGITVKKSKGSAGSFVNYADANTTPTVFISNQAASVKAAALQVDGGQIVKTEVIISDHIQTLNDYILIVDNGGNNVNITLLNPLSIPEGTMLFIRKIVNSDFLNVISPKPIIMYYNPATGVSSTLSAISFTNDTSIRLVSSKSNGGRWIQL